MERRTISPLAIKPVLNRFHKSLPPQEASDYEVREWLNTWLGRESQTLRGALNDIHWNGKEIRELTKEAMVYELDRGFRALENFHYLDDPMESAEGLATDIQLAKEHEAKCLRNGNFCPRALLRLIVILGMFLAGYIYAIFLELGIDWKFSDHALRLSVIILALIIFIRAANEDED